MKISFPQNPDFKDIIADESLIVFIKFLRQAVHQQTVLPSYIFDVIRKFCTDLDQKLSAQLNEVIHHPEFKTLESAWRGLHFLVSNTYSHSQLKIKMMHLTKKELLKDFERSVNFDQSYIFKKIHDDEYGVSAGQPYSVIIGNYEFNFSPQDISILENFAKVAETAYTPFIASVTSEAISQNLQNQQWQRLRQKPEAMFLSLCTPRILLRNIYADHHEFDGTIPVESFSFTEEINSKDDYLWGNAAFAVGIKLTETFEKYKWCVKIDGFENEVNGGKIAKIKVPHPQEFHHIVNNSLDKILTPPEEEKLREDGFNVVSNYYDSISFLRAISCAKPQTTNTELGNLTFKNFVALPETFAVSRFAHYLKMLILDNQYCRTPEDWHNFLNRWIRQYCELDGNRCSEFKPLKSALINLQKDTSQTETSYVAVCFIKAGFQIPEIGIERRIVIRNVPIHRPSRYETNVQIPENKEDIQPSQPKQFKIGLPRQLVNITYDIEVGSSIEKKELPFVAGVIGDFVGNPLEPLPKFSQRKFIKIDSDNFDQVLAAFKPRVNFKVKNTLQNDSSELDVELNFEQFADFEPDNIVQKIEPLKKLVEARQQLWELWNKADSDSKLEEFLQVLLENSAKL